MCWSVWESGDIFLLVSHQHSTVNSHMCVHCAEEIKRCEGFNRDAFKKIRKKYINPTKKLTYCALPSSSKHINKRSPQAHKQIVKKEVLKRRDSGLLVYFLCPIVCLKLSLIFSPFHSIYIAKWQHWSSVISTLNYSFFQLYMGEDYLLVGRSQNKYHP